ncbi:hypothetical protein CLAIMM_03293 [Cladophialophora immunda]|nr:hypothetical protein CLAIMM_03293 [Cladophialophora immunda]
MLVQFILYSMSTSASSTKLLHSPRLRHVPMCASSDSQGHLREPGRPLPRLKDRSHISALFALTERIGRHLSWIFALAQSLPQRPPSANGRLQETDATWYYQS